MPRFCYTCLCQDRKLTPLNSFQVKSTLLEWFEGSSFQVNVEDFITCWECSAKIIHFNKFKRQVFRAQEIRLKVDKKKSARLVNLSTLTVYTKETFDMEYVHEESGNSHKSLQKRKRESSKQHKEKTRTKPTKRKRREKEPEPKVEQKIYHIYNYFNDKNTIDRQETDETVSRQTETVKTHTIVDLTKDPKLSSRPVVLLDKVKEEIIVDSDDDVENNNNVVPNITDNNVTVVNEEEKEGNNNVNETEKDSNNTITEVVIDKEIKQELIDDYNNDTDTTTTIPESIDNEVIDISEDIIKQECIEENDSETDVIDMNPEQEHRPSVIMKVEPNGDDKIIRMDSSLKFSVVNLSEEEMLDTRDKDRNERMFLKHFFKCESCVVSFSDIAELEKHNEDKHSEILGEFECPVCATRFNSESLLTRHEQTHYFSYKCLQCEFSHHRRYVIEMHVVKEHDLPASPVCSACDTDFATQRRLKAHFEKAHKEKLKCNQCGESFDTVDHLKNHAHSHIEKDDLIEIYSCDLCSDSFEGKASYRAHMQCAHKDLAQLAYCEECDRQFANVEEFRHHLKKSKMHTLFDQQLDCASSEDTSQCDSKRAQRMLSHSCGLCKKVPARSVRLKFLSRLICLAANVHRCPPCLSMLHRCIRFCYTFVAQLFLLQGFSDAIRLKNHIQEKHPEVAKKKKPLKDKICPICSEGYISRNTLLEHIRTHKAKKPFQCEQCDKSFVSKALLNKHVRTHALDDSD